MPNPEKGDSAATIQRWWRRKLEMDQKLADKARRLAESRYLSKISLQNDALLEKLEKLRKEKDYEKMKFERIMNMPAGDVYGFLRAEAEKQTEVKDDGRSELVERALEKHRHEAARIIQRTFRKFYSQRIAEKYLRTVTVIKPSRRVLLLEKINNRLGSKQFVRTFPLEEIKQATSDHHDSKKKEAVAFARRQQLLQDVNRTSMAISMVSLDHLTPSMVNMLKGSGALSEFKGRRLHDEIVASFDEEEWK